MVLVVADELTVSTIANAKATLMAALELGGDIEVDARGVCEVDMAGLQLLLAAKREAEALGHRFSLPVSLCSETLARGLAVAGLTEALGVHTSEMNHG